MPVIQAEASQEQLLRAVEQLKPDELEQFVAQVLSIRAGKVAPHLPLNEATLLLRINASLAPELQQRFNLLVERRQQEQLTATEHTELLVLTNQIEQFDAERAAALVQLATMRQTTVNALMQALGIQPPAYV